jgi:Uma2 family endonuclease
MQSAGVLAPDERLELIEGVLVAMNAKKNNHEIVKNELVELLALRKPKTVRLAVESSLFLAPDCVLEPDILLYRKTLLPEDVRGPDALLVIEIADTSQARDLQVKAPLYARHCVRDYWVVDVAARITTVHRAPGPDGYGEISEQPADAALQPLLLEVPALVIPWAG